MVRSCIGVTADNAKGYVCTTALAVCCGLFAYIEVYATDGVSRTNAGVAFERWCADETATVARVGDVLDAPVLKDDPDVLEVPVVEFCTAGADKNAGYKLDI
jgi:hypothetical protein